MAVIPIHRKRRITITGQCPDTAPVLAQYQQARRKVRTLVYAGIPNTSRYLRNAVRDAAQARLRFVFLEGRRKACKLIVAVVPYKRPARTNEIRQAIKEGVEE